MVLSQDQLKKIRWPQRLALIKRFNPTDAQIRQAFACHQPELDTVRSLVASHTLVQDQTFDTEPYNGLFAESTGQPSSDDELQFFKVQPSTRTPSTAAGFRRRASKDSFDDMDCSAKPETANRRPPEKRGRRGNNIINAFRAIPRTPTPAEDFCQQHNISIHVARQSARFLKTASTEDLNYIGTVFVRKDRTSNQLMIWRDGTQEAPQETPDVASTS